MLMNFSGMDDSRDFTALLTRKCRRKEARKTKKKLGTLCRVAYSKHKNVESVIQEQLNTKTTAEKKREKKRRQREARAQRSAQKTDEDELVVFKREAEQKRREILEEDADAELEEIAMLEHKLGLDKKKKKTTTKKQILPNNDAEADEATRKKRAEHYVDDLFDALEEEDRESTAASAIDSGSDQEGSSQEDKAKNPSEESDSDMDDDGSMNDEQEEEDDEEMEDSSQIRRRPTLANDDEEDNGEEIDEDDAEDLDQSSSAAAPAFDENILALARRAKLGTELRERIFCTLMATTGSGDTFERLKALSLEGPEEREIVHVCVRCVLLEANYNPFYAVLVGKFCEWRKQFRLTTQFAMWDAMKELSGLKQHRFENLAAFVADLIKLQALGFTVFKMVDFDEDGRTVAFVKRVVHRLLTKAPDAMQRQAFMRLVNSNKHRRFTADFENFLAQLSVEEFRQFDDFDMFQRQLGVAKRLFAIR